MNENNNAVVQNAGDVETPQAISPQAEVQAEAPVQTPTEQQPVEVEQNEQDDPREFQNRRLAEDNRKLKAELEARQRNESAFDMFRPTQAPQAPTGVNIYDYVDQESGTVDWNAYNASVNNAIAQSSQVASYTAQQTTREIIDEQNARSRHPEVFANPELEKQAAAMYLFEKMQGNNVSVSDIAARIAGKQSKAIAQAEKAGAEKILSEVSEKEAASLTASAQTSAPARLAQSQDELEGLRQSSRGRGQESTDAVAKRLNAIGWRGQR